MNQTLIQDKPRGTQVELYAAEVIGDDAHAAELFRALPAHIKPERFQRNLINALMQNPDMLKYDPRFVYREVSKAAALGLLLDPQLGEAYIVPVWNAKASRAEPQLRVGYRGIIKLGRQSGELTSIYAHEVHENDEIICELGVEKRLVHKPLLFGDRGAVIGYYAVVKFKNGDNDFEPMTLDQIRAIRDKSDGWRAFKAGKIKSTPWSTDEGEMAKKTVIKRLCKRIPQSPDLATALSFENDASREPQNLVVISRDTPRPPQTIEARLDRFAEIADEPNSNQAEADRHSSAEAEGAPATSVPEESASAPEHPPYPGTADAGSIPEHLRDAMEKGRLARRGGHPREIPTGLHYKSKQPEAAAYLSGWDEEDIEMKAADNGTV